ncbi:MAG: NADP-dependent malic enzyme [Candidatus Aminicenantes bacterium]|nr:NADP-dependent malic enzyme [Candidatus Aminicenantes bacterium]
MAITKKEALDYHCLGRKGKIEVTSTKPCLTQRDLSLAYTPGVAEPCREIEKDPELAYNYTAKGNLVAVVSNGTAVLGLGNIGALAGKPVMEGKGVLFKRFADIDVFDIEVNSEDPEEVIKVVKLLEPTFGGINLEDIKAPECFQIEETLIKELNIPVFHDDQHGTAIISGAGLMNALEIQKKQLNKVRIVINGAGASGIAIANLYVELGAKRENIVMCDSRGVIYKGREKGMNPYKEKYASETKARTLAEAMKGADVFVGVSVADVVSKEMIASMAENPIAFAMANPDPEIKYEDAVSVRKDLIMATGRSDYPNQVNNVLGFPFIFRGALDVRATAINMQMKVAASHALADLAKEDVPDSVLSAYGNEKIKFGPEYIIPKPFDPRVLLWEASAVAKAAMDTGVARIKMDIEEYKVQLESRLGKTQEVMRFFINKAKARPKRIVFPEGEEEKVLRACQVIVDEGIGTPILIGDKEEIMGKIKDFGFDYADKAEIIELKNFKRFEDYKKELYRMRERKGVTYSRAGELLNQNRIYLGTMMVHMGDADCLVSGLNKYYPETIRPALRIIKTSPKHRIAAGLYIMIFKNDIMFFADATVNIDPTSQDLADIAISTAETARKFGVTPKVAMLSFSNFGSARHPLSDKVRKAVEIVKEREPDLVIDGEMQGNTALKPELLTNVFPFSKLKEKANVLIFPDLQSGNIAYRLLERFSGAKPVGPILIGMAKPVHILSRDATVDDIVNLSAIAVVEAEQT